MNTNAVCALWAISTGDNCYNYFTGFDKVEISNYINECTMLATDTSDNLEFDDYEHCVLVMRAARRLCTLRILFSRIYSQITCYSIMVLIE